VISVESLDLRGFVVPVAASETSFSDDRRFLAFVSADGWFPGDVNDRDDVFHRDRLTGTIRKCSVDASGGPANGSSSRPAYRRWTTGRLQFGREQPRARRHQRTHRHLPLRHLDADDRARHALLWRRFGNSWSGLNTPISISADDRFVAFSSRASNLVPGFTLDQYRCTCATACSA
jgi:hypothetical protein